MKRSDVVLSVVVGVGLFMVGVVWRPVFGDHTKLKDALECTSFLATTVAAVVAISALNAWKEQFRHAESFKALKDLKDAATGLHTFRGYLLAVTARCVFLMQSGHSGNEAIEAEVEVARQKWLVALEGYNRAWSTAVVFFTPEEEENFCGPAKIFTSRSLSDPMKIVTAYANAPGKENLLEFTILARTITDDAKHLYARTVSELEWMLRQKYRVAST